jgi:HTH-type transcriptional regulator, glycine betaine synthesis regulator
LIGLEVGFTIDVVRPKWMIPMQPSPATPEPSGSTEGPTRALDRVEQEFVALWRNMSALWGISPTMAQIHGLLFITGESLSMDDIMGRLGIARSNVSTNLPMLVEWGLVRRAHRKGGRREYYEALTDVWEMFTLIAAQRKRREIDPLLDTLRRCAERLPPTTSGEQAASARRQRVDDLLSFLGLVDTLATTFFESHKSLRTAVDLLAERRGEGNSTKPG